MAEESAPHAILIIDDDKQTRTMLATLLTLEGWMALGFVAGAYAGGRWAQAISELALRRLFAVTLVLVAIRMWFEA